jgi:hypothetical protein
MLHDSVKTSTLRALYSKKMPVATATLGFTIVAHDVDDTFEIRGHGLFGNVSRASFPGCRHALLAHHRLLANGTAVVKASQLTKAMSMNGCNEKWEG